MISESEYHQLVDDILVQLEEALDECEVDIDYESAEGILTLIFENNTRIVLNKQEPLLQLWVATKYNGHHFNYHGDGVWIDQRTDAEFWSFINAAVSKQAEADVVLNKD